MTSSRALVVVAIICLVACSLVACGKKGGDAAAGAPGGAAGGKMGAPGGMAMPGAPGGGSMPGMAGGGGKMGPGGSGMPGMAGPGGGGMPGMAGPGGGGMPGMAGPGGGGMPGPGGAPGGAPGGTPGGGAPGAAPKGGPAGGPPSEGPEPEAVPLSDVEVAALVDRALEAKRAGDLDTALQLVSEAIKARPDNAKANWVGAWILADKGDTALAIGQFERTAKLGLDEKQSRMAEAAIKRLKARDE